MIRTLLISTAILATAGAANAETIKVSLAGKTEAAVKVEISKASETVCRYAPVMEYAPCVHETYQDAMAQVARLKALRTASLTY
jgi:hypothetical protein